MTMQMLAGKLFFGELFQEAWFDLGVSLWLVLRSTFNIDQVKLILAGFHKLFEHQHLIRITNKC